MAKMNRNKSKVSRVVGAVKSAVNSAVATADASLAAALGTSVGTSPLAAVVPPLSERPPVKSGDPCEVSGCNGKLRVYHSFKEHGFLHQYLTCNVCRGTNGKVVSRI